MHPVLRTSVSIFPSEISALERAIERKRRKIDALQNQMLEHNTTAHNLSLQGLQLVNNSDLFSSDGLQKITSFQKETLYHSNQAMAIVKQMLKEEKTKKRLIEQLGRLHVARAGEIQSLVDLIFFPELLANDSILKQLFQK